MGKSQSKISQSYTINLNEWERSASRSDRILWVNKTTHQTIQEFSMIVNQSKLYDKVKAVHQLRYGSQTLVASRFFIENSQSEMCSTFYKATIYLEYIPFRISNFQDIPYPDVLNIYQNSFRGFSDLYTYAGFFAIDQEMIGFNNRCQTKVWYNPQLCVFDKIQNQQPTQNSPRTQKYMVDKLIQIISSRSRFNQNQPNIGRFLIDSNPKTLKQAEVLLNTFATRSNISIPDQVDSIVYVDQNKNYTSNIQLGRLASQHRGDNIFVNTAVQYGTELKRQRVSQIPQVINRSIVTQQSQQLTNQRSQRNRISAPIVSNNVKFMSNSQSQNLSNVINTNPFVNVDRRTVLINNSTINNQPNPIVSNPSQTLVNMSLKGNNILNSVNTVTTVNQQQGFGQRTSITNPVLNRRNDIKIVYGNNRQESNNLNNNFGRINQKILIRGERAATITGQRAGSALVGTLNYPQNRFDQKQITQTRTVQTPVQQTQFTGTIIQQNPPLQYPSSAGITVIPQTQKIQVVQTENIQQFFPIGNSNNLNQVQFNKVQKIQSTSSQPTFTSQSVSQTIPNPQIQSSNYESYNYNFTTGNVGGVKEQIIKSNDYNYEYTSPQILALLKQDFNYSSQTSAVGDKHTISNLNEINQMKYSIYQDNSLKYQNNNNESNVQNNTITYSYEKYGKTNETATNQVEYTGGYSFRGDADLLKDLERLKEVNKN